jgi:hypothetical protein
VRTKSTHRVIDASFTLMLVEFSAFPELEWNQAITAIEREYSLRRSSRVTPGPILLSKLHKLPERESAWSECSIAIPKDPLCGLLIIKRPARQRDWQKWARDSDKGVSREQSC